MNLIKVMNYANQIDLEDGASNIRHKSFHSPPPSRSDQPPLDSETGWTGELWLKTNLLK